TSKRILGDYGIHTPQSMVVQSDSDIDEALQCFPMPVVLKLISPDVLHKSDFGAVVLGLNDAAAIKAAINNISQRCLEHDYKIEGFLLEETIGQGHEIVI